MANPDDERVPSANTSSADMQSPIDLLEQEHRLFIDICTAFERVADGLPEEADLELARRATAILNIHQPAHYADETTILFPALREKVGRDHVIARTLDELEKHRQQDADILIELNEVLNTGFTNRRPDNPDMLGYMLRFYFTSERRQIGWERTIVLPAARLLMSESDLSRLREQLQASDRFKASGLDKLAVRHEI